MERFWSKVEKTDTCWLWKASTRAGYGSFKLNGKVIFAHRFSYELANNGIDKDLMVCHKCDNPLCVNPDHLFLGTNSDNMKDCYSKGRMKLLNGIKFKKGDRPDNRVLSDLSVKEIKKLIINKKELKLTLQKIADIFNINVSTIKDIASGRSYINI